MPQIKIRHRTVQLLFMFLPETNALLQKLAFGELPVSGREAQAP